MSLERFVKEKIVDAFGQEMEKGGLQAAVAAYLETANILPVANLAEHDPERFAELRHRLATESGLIIANHPGFCDTPIILSALTREDLKVIVSKENFAQLGPIIGEDKLIEATDDPHQIREVLRDIQSHIEGGGIVLLYPTGGADRADKSNDIRFKDGFSVIVRKCLRPTDMVYSFLVDRTDIQALVDEDISRNTGAASAFVLGDAINPNHLKDIATIRYDEAYSTAGEWQDLLAQAPTDASRDDKNHMLAQHFVGQFQG